MAQPSRNTLLAALPPDEYRRLLPHLQTVELANGQSLPYCGETRAYFLLAGMCSIGTVMEDGRAIEIASVGREGVVGLSAFGPHRTFGEQTFRHVGRGSAQFIALEVLEREVARGGVLRSLIDRYARALFECIVQSAACNRLHSLQERCTRWLLTAHDRLGRDRVEIEQPFLAAALGVKPALLSVAIRELAALGALTCDERNVTILSRRLLQRVSCGCYKFTRRALSHTTDIRQAHRGHASPLSSNVVHLVPSATCPRCGSAVGLPHPTEHHCIRAVDLELHVLRRRIQELQAQRQSLVGSCVESTRKFIDSIRRRSVS
jgi:CRP-like cAMP-binding protein